MQTRVSLLARIRDLQDALAWAEFVRLYSPLLYASGIKNGLQDSDAADFARKTLRCVLRAVPGLVYDPARGSFRGWLFTIARNALRKAANRPLVVSGGSDVQALLEAEPEREAGREDWDREYQLNLFHWAAEREKAEFRARTWPVIWRTAVRGEAIDPVAAELGLTTGAVYIARSRVTARIRSRAAAPRVALADRRGGANRRRDCDSITEPSGPIPEALGAPLLGE